MADAFQVSTPALTGHVRGLTDLSKEVSAALSAADVTMTGDAYGQAGAKLAAGLADVSKKGQVTLQAGIDALVQAATAIRDTVTTYEEHETTCTDTFTKLGGLRP